METTFNFTSQHTYSVSCIEIEYYSVGWYFVDGVYPLFKFPTSSLLFSPLKCDEVKYVNLSHNFLINTISVSSITSSLKLWWGESNNTK